MMFELFTNANEPTSFFCSKTFCEKGHFRLGEHWR